MGQEKNLECRVFCNGRIYTADERKPFATAFVLSGNRFLYVGNDEEAAKYGPAADLHGKCVIPGLAESHAHMVGNALNGDRNLFYVDPETTPGELPEVLRQISRSPQYASEQVLTGMGIRLTKGSFSGRDIDRAVPDRPVFLFSDDGHALLMNGKGLALAGIRAETKDPSAASYFVRDENGSPDGLAVEIPAMQLCLSAIRPRGSLRAAEKLDEILREYARLGFTAGFDAATVTDGDPAALDLLQAYEAAGKLKMRLFTSFVYYGEDRLPVAELLPGMKRARDRYASALVHPTTLKMIADGTVENLSALLYDPYCVEDAACSAGTLSPEDMKNAAENAAGAGFHVHIHAIGDKAIDEAVGVLSGMGKRNVTKTIAHNQVYTPQSIGRMAEAGDIFFQTTPYWFVRDDDTERLLGKERMKHLFPAGSMIRNGVRVTFGSDSLDGEICRNPFAGMFFAVVRGIPGNGICFPPESEGITREEALKAYTISGAMQLGAGDEIGSIAEGKLADFVILDRDIMKVPPEDLLFTGVDATYFDGTEIYERAGKSAPYLDGRAAEKIRRQFCGRGR